MWWIALAVLLYICCAALIIAEVFFPSRGLISVCAFVCLAGGLALFFSRGQSSGIIGIVIAVLIIPTVSIIAYKIFPKKR